MNKQSLERLKELLEYNPETGKVTIKKSQRTLTADQDGIVVIFDSKAHCVLLGFFYHTKGRSEGSSQES